MQNEHQERSEARLATAQLAATYGMRASQSFRRLAVARWLRNQLAGLRGDVGSPSTHMLAVLAAVARLAASLAGVQIVLELVARARDLEQGIPGVITAAHLDCFAKELEAAAGYDWMSKQLDGGKFSEESILIANAILRDLWMRGLDGADADLGRVLDCIVESAGAV